MTILVYYYIPLRKEWSDMLIWDGAGAEPKDINYFYFEGDDAYIVINKDKVSKHERHRANNKIQVNYTLNKQKQDYFLEEIKRSLQDFPRKYILSKKTNGNKPLGYTGLTDIMRETFRFMGREPTIVIFRSNFVSYYQDKGLSKADKDLLGKLMRNTQNTQEVHYNKVPSSLPKVDEENLNNLLKDKAESIGKPKSSNARGKKNSRLLQKILPKK